MSLLRRKLNKDIKVIDETVRENSAENSSNVNDAGASEAKAINNTYNDIDSDVRGTANSLNDTYNDDNSINIGDIDVEVNNQDENKKSFKNQSTQGKIKTILGTIFTNIIDLLSYIIVFIIATLSVFYIFYKFKNVQKDPYPENPEKFPYVFFDKTKSFDEQEFMSSVIMDNDRTKEDPLFRKVSPRTKDGKLDIDATLSLLNQPQNIDNSNQMNFFASFFNKINGSVVGSSFGLMNIVLYVMMTGIMSINSSMNLVHNTLGGFFRYALNNENNYISMTIVFMLAFMLTIALFTMFNDSRESFYNLIRPMMNSSPKYDNMSVLMLNLISAVMSGFMSFSKLFFVTSYTIFIISSIIRLLSLRSLESMSAAFYSMILMLSFFVSSATIIVDIFKKMTSKNNSNNDTSFTDKLIASIFETIIKAFSSLKDYVVKITEQFRKAITPSEMLNAGGTSGKNNEDNCGAETKDSSNSFTNISNMLFYILSLPLYFCFLPFLLIPILFFIISLVCVCIPFFASIYTSLNFAMEISFNSIMKIQELVKYIKPHYLSILLALFVFFIILKEDNILIKSFGENIELNLVSNITNILITMVCFALYSILYYFVIKPEVRRTNLRENTLLSVPYFVGGSFVIYELISVINSYNMKKNKD